MNKKIIQSGCWIGLALVITGCTPLKKTGKFVWSIPGGIVHGVAATGKGLWHITPKSGADLKETAKVIWGSSTRALEEARTDAIAKTYRCSFTDCYESVLSLAREEPKYVTTEAAEGFPVGEEPKKVIEPEKKGVFDVFINDRRKRHIVVMGIAGNVDTTEVGIFFTQPSLTTVKLEVSSLSSSAKRSVAEAVFKELDAKFSAVE